VATADPVALPPEIMPALQGAVPATIITCALDGQPNTTTVSQVHHVDANHVALSFQFFSKTIRNIRENPYAAAQLINPADFSVWLLDLRYDHSESEGPLFDNMDMQLEAIASMTGMTGVFKLRAADVYEVLSVRKAPWRRD
jgi:uncharacterized protein